MFHKLLGHFATELGHDLEPGTPFGGRLDPSVDLAIPCKSTTRSGRGKIDAQGFGDVDKRSSQFPECGPKFAGECGGGSDDGRFRGNEARLKLVLDKVVEVLPGFRKVCRDGFISARGGALEVVHVHVEAYTWVPDNEGVELGDVVNLHKSAGPRAAGRHAAVWNDCIGDAFTKH